MAAAVLIVGLLVFLAHGFSALFQRTRMPDVLPLLLLGLLAGPVTGFVTPESVGRVGEVFALIVLAVILFESGLGLDFDSLREALAPGLRLTLAAFVSTVALVGAAASLFGPFSLLEGMMLGAILGGTSSAVVIPMSELLPLRPRTRTILMLESTFSDVLCIVVTLALIQAARYNELRPGLMAGQILASFLLASLIGFVGGLFWSHVLERVRRSKNSIFTTPAFMCVIYGLSELLGYSGAIAALAFGFTLGNIELVASKLRLAFRSLPLKPTRISGPDEVLFAEVVFLLKTFFFVYIGASIRFSNPVLVAAGLGLTVALLALRVPVVRLAVPAGTPRFDAATAWAMIPKGLAAAVLAGLPAQEGILNGEAMKAVVYAVILFSIVAAALVSFLLERNRLGAVTGALFSPFPVHVQPEPAAPPMDRSAAKG